MPIRSLLLIIPPLTQLNTPYPSTAYLTGFLRPHGYSVVQADLGKTCYIVDDETVAKTDGTATRSAAGKVVGLDSDGVWVE